MIIGLVISIIHLYLAILLTNWLRNSNKYLVNEFPQGLEDGAKPAYCSLI